MKSGYPHVPAFRLAVLLIAGILVQMELALPTNTISIFFLASLIILSILFFTGLANKTLLGLKMQGATLIFVSVLVGCMLVNVHNPLERNNYFGKYLEGANSFTCRVTDIPEEKEKTIKLVVEVTEANTETGLLPVSGKAIIYLDKKLLNIHIPEYGSVLIARNNFQLPPEATNPGGFNYRKYLSAKGIYYTAYLKESEFITTDKFQKDFFWSLIFTSREYFTNQLIKYIPSINSQGVALALILGNRTLLDMDTRDSFAHTGTMHVLAVSGLHVGIFYAILEMLFNTIPFFRKKLKNKSRFIKPLIIVACIWFYACITGLSPSIFRSAVMFTILAFGRLEGQHINSYNVLAASAIILMFINPFMILEVGFQLSFLAVLGIVAYQPPMYKLWKIKNQIGKYIWSLTTVSMAAQMGTVPVTIFYFHQFPNYFLLTNIIAIPVAFLILVAGVFLFCVSWIPVAGIIAGGVLHFFITILTTCMSFAETIPGALTEYMHWNIYQTLAMYCVAICLALMLATKQKDYLYGLLVSFIVFFAITIQQKIHLQKNRTLAFLQIKNTTAIAWYDGNELHILGNEKINQVSPAFTYTIKPLMQQFRVKHFNYHCLDSNNMSDNYILSDNVLICGNNSVYHLQSNQLPEKMMEKIDYLLISNNPFLSLEKTAEIFPGAAWIFDNTNSYKSISYWEKYCSQKAIAFHSILQEGAMIIE